MACSYREPGRIELDKELRKISRCDWEDVPKEEYYAINRKICEYAQETEEKVADLAYEYQRRKKDYEARLSYVKECPVWMRRAPTLRRGIATVFSREWKRLQKWQGMEIDELFPFTDDSETESNEQNDRLDLNQEIAFALASHTVPRSPADYTLLEGYGDLIESTQSEKSGSKDWNLLGLRGTEAIQVGSHRGPPTDRPPDKPPPTVGVFAGCLQERASTRHLCQLASFSRSSHCSSGNVTPLAANAFLGNHASEQYCVHAVGTSHEVNRELSWMLPRCGRFRGNRIRVRALCRPSSNLGRNFFPLWRFSYHTRFSRFNGTA
jgi:hypothetical protein